MGSDVLAEILSSPNSLGIAALVSVRPRTQSELAELTGVSVPAVLMHLRRLRRLGLIRENKINNKLLGVRRVYTANGILVGDFSQADLKVVKLHKKPEFALRHENPIKHLEALAEDLLLQKRRIREQVRRIGRMIDDMLEDQARLSSIAAAAGRGIGERLILETVFSEEDPVEGERILVRHYGLKGGRRSIDRLMTETLRFAQK